MIWQTKRNLRGASRAAVYVSFVGLVSLFISAKNARAELEDRTMTLGRQMLMLAKASQHDVTNVDVNGQHVYLGSSLTTDGVERVLERYEEHCKQNASHSDQEAIRSGSESEGIVVCFTKSARTIGSLTEAISSFGTTGELSRIGNARFVYAKRSPHTGNTTVLTAWTDERFNVLELAAEERGSDFPSIPRMPGSTRLFSATAIGTPYGVNVYKSSSDPAAVLAFYDTAMEQDGWMPVLLPEGRLYSKDGVVLTLASSKEEGETFIGLGLAGVSR